MVGYCSVMQHLYCMTRVIYGFPLAYITLLNRFINNVWHICNCEQCMTYLETLKCSVAFGRLDAAISVFGLVLSILFRTIQ